jgi:hypothetical protein
MRAIHRLRLYVQIGKRYQTAERRHRKVGTLFSLWTMWEFDEVRSVATGIILAFREQDETPESCISSMSAISSIIFTLIRT